MSVYAEAVSGHEDLGGRRDQRRMRRCGRGWKPVELLAMILGFILFWPIGLGILAWKIWQKRSGYEGDIATFTQEKWQEAGMRNWSMKQNCGMRREGWGRGPFAMRSTGNVAFDDWRDAELARLEEERQKLVAAEAEFNQHLENLRRAKDREEFDRFMSERRKAQGGDTGTH